MNPRIFHWIQGQIFFYGEKFIFVVAILNTHLRRGRGNEGVINTQGHKKNCAFLECRVAQQFSRYFGPFSPYCLAMNSFQHVPRELLHPRELLRHSSEQGHYSIAKNTPHWNFTPYILHCPCHFLQETPALTQGTLHVALMGPAQLNIIIVIPHNHQNP